RSCSSWSARSPSASIVAPATPSSPTRSRRSSVSSTACWREAGLLKRRQSRFDLLSARLEERRQRQSLAHRLKRLVGREPWTVGRDLEQHAVRFPEIEALEIEAVDLAAVRDAHLAQPFRPRVVGFIAR